MKEISQEWGTLSLIKDIRHLFIIQCDFEINSSFYNLAIINGIHCLINPFYISAVLCSMYVYFTVLC